MRTLDELRETIKRIDTASVDVLGKRVKYSANPSLYLPSPNGQLYIRLTIKNMSFLNEFIPSYAQLMKKIAPEDIICDASNKHICFSACDALNQDIAFFTHLRERFALVPEIASGKLKKHGKGLVKIVQRGNDAEIIRAITDNEVEKEVVDNLKTAAGANGFNQEKTEAILDFYKNEERGFIRIMKKAQAVWLNM